MGKLYGPDARPRADVQDATGVDERGYVELAVEEDLEGVVLQVEALLLDLVVGQEVFCVALVSGRGRLVGLTLRPAGQRALGFGGLLSELKA